MNSNKTRKITTVKITKLFDKIFLSENKNNLEEILKTFCEYLYDMPVVLCKIICDYCTQDEHVDKFLENGETYIIHNFFKIVFSGSVIKIYLRECTENYFYNFKMDGRRETFCPYVFENIIQLYHKSNFTLIRYCTTYSFYDITNLSHVTKNNIHNTLSPNKINDYDVILENSYNGQWLIFILKNDYVKDLFKIMNYIIGHTNFRY